MDVEELGPQLRILRDRSNLSIRQLADRADVTPAMISLIERNKTSPSLGMLQKILTALGTNLATFADQDKEQVDLPVVLREQMRVISDDQRSYTVIFPRQKDVRVELLDERIHPVKSKPPFETLSCDVAGYLIAGEMALEVQGVPKRTLRAGDAFYVIRGQVHRGYAIGKEVARLITTFSPPRY